MISSKSPNEIHIKKKNHSNKVNYIFFCLIFGFEQKKNNRNLKNTAETVFSFNLDSTREKFKKT